MFPIFFSVSSRDVGFAEQVWSKLPENWAYLYSKTGEEGALMWDEISRSELPQSQLLVVFWSKSYITSAGCVREMLQAKELVQQHHLRPLVLRLDEFPIKWDDKFDGSTKPVFEALGSMLDYRTSSPNVPVQQAIDLVQRMAEPMLRSDHPRMPRHDLQQALRGVVQRDRFQYYPAVWVSGFNGVGRETLIRDFNRSFTPNGRGVLIELDEASLPRQMLLRIESEALGANRERLHQLNASPPNDEIKALVDAIERVFTAGNFIIFRHSRIVEENVELPEWLDEVVNKLQPATRPKVFIISQLPLLGERRSRCRDSLVAQRVPTVDEHQLIDFCYQLIGHFDRNPGRWTDSEVERIVRASGGTIGFLVSLVRSASQIEDFDQIDQLVVADSGDMAASITVYVRWAFSQLRDFEDEQRALLFLDNISPCDVTDIERAVAPKRPMLRVLGKLLELGLVERESENLFRLTPLLARRLNRDLIRPDLLLWSRRALVEFAKKPFEIEGEPHEYLRIESRIKASILGETDVVPNSVLDFVSAAHWFQAGIRLYHARRREPAYRVLKKAFLKRAEFTTASRSELIRYFGLSATRNRRYGEAEDCIRLLDSVYETKGIASFLRADLLEHQRKYMEAISSYIEAIRLNQGKNSRLERTYRPLVQCILASPRPDFALAERYAKDWLKIRQTVFSLMALARVYLHWKYRGHKYQRDVPDEIDLLYNRALSVVEAHPGVGSAHFELKAEEAEFSGDSEGSVAYMDKAVEADPRFELRYERWRLMAKSGVQSLVEKVLRELDVARNNPEFRGNWLPFLPALAETYAIALYGAGRPLGAISTFAPELHSDEVGAIVSRVRRRR